MKILLIIVSFFLIAGCSHHSEEESLGNKEKSFKKIPAKPGETLRYGSMDNITSDQLDNPVAYIPAQCYTNVEDGNHNPCYACHTESKEPNYLSDSDVQVVYSAPDPGEINHWKNLFVDNTEAISQISDEDILKYVREDNYKDANGNITLARKLNDLPAQWDRNSNDKWDGYTPDAYFNFDEKGFDKSPNGSYSGWRVFAYYPFLGTFMPTNGSTDDVLIRLHDDFQKDENGQFDINVYEINLAVIEAMIKQQDIEIATIDERKYHVDLDKNGQLGMTSIIKYEWKPLDRVFMSYVGLAKKKLDNQEIKMAARLFPTGTEFLHSVRYVDVNGNKTKMSPRMKELRYAKKSRWRNYYQLETIIDNEIKERHDFPERVKTVMGNMEEGLHLAHGWTYQGFIEDDAGELRPQTYEETYFCVGCHGGVGATDDTIFSFNRKLSTKHFKSGWYHWLEKNFENIPDSKREDGNGQYAFYLDNNPTGSEFRNNMEVYNKFFTADGTRKPEAFKKLSSDISYLLMPSVARAIELNKAYYVLVKEQSFKYGREAHVKPLVNVKKSMEIDAATGIKKTLSYF